MKTLSDLWKEFDKKGLILSPEGLSDLKWHIENDEDPWDAISAAEDMIIESQSSAMKEGVASSVAKQLYHKNSSIREIATRFIKYLSFPECGQDLYNIAHTDDDEFVRILATKGFGYIMNEVDKKLAYKMAMHLHEILTNDDFEKYGKSYRDSASDSVLAVIDHNYIAFGRAWNDPDFDPIWKKFLKKYKLEYKPVFRR